MIFFLFLFFPPSQLTRTSTHLILARAQQRSVVTTVNPARQPMAQTAGSGRSPIFAATPRLVRAFRGELAGGQALGSVLPPREVSRQSKVPRCTRACQDHGVKRAGAAKGGRMAGMLIPHVSVARSPPVRFSHPTSSA